MTTRADAHRPEFHREDAWKQPVRVATTANITIATALNSGDSIDGVTLATGDRVLVKDQSTGSQNGIYDVAATPVRSYDMDTGVEALGAIVYVIAGTANGGKQFRNTNATLPTIGSTALTFATVVGGFTDPMTTRGDVLVRDASNVTARLPIGANGTFLGSDGTDVSWQTPSGGGAANAHNENEAAVLVNATSTGDAGSRSDHFAGSSLTGWSSESTALSVGPTVKYSVFAGAITAGNINNHTKAFTPSGAFRIEGRMRFQTNTNNAAAGIGVRDSSSGETNGTLVYCLLRAESGILFAHTYSVVSGSFTDRGEASVGQTGGWNGWTYLAIARDGSNNWTTFVSGDRVNWIAASGGWSQTITITKIVFRIGDWASFDFIDVVS